MTSGRTLPRAGNRLPAKRRWTGLAIALVGLPALTAVLSVPTDTLALGTVLMLYIMVVVLTAAVGGIGPGALAAAFSFLLANWFLVPPFHTLSVDRQDSAIELVVFTVVAGVVSAIVHLAAREQANAARSRLESQVLSRFTSEPVSMITLDGVLNEVRATFGMTSAALVERDIGDVVARVGPQEFGRPSISVPASDSLLLVAYGPTLFAEDRRVLTRLASTAARAWEGQQLTEQAARVVELAAVDRARSALLAAVGHDLRTPLAGIKASVSSLRQDDVDWTPTERSELLEAIEEGADRLTGLIANLLAMSRLEAGGVSAKLAPVALDEVVARTLLTVVPAEVTIDVPDDLPLILSDVGLLERVVDNVVDNARRYARSGVRITARQVADRLELAVVDDGPGVAEADWPHMFTPFQRLNDRSTSGVGLGLAIAEGFAEAIGATLRPSTTPNGGLTMTLSLPLADA
ncbi:sensor histidine kinase [Pengzhenrongella sp.]|jgi:K+-sensing histidine kinase KdpD|uniref:sensor histidine kinase n=1 Tax=Pengzhenrongella sp. TaxID=2888820 RepID=UPI002F954F84